MKDAADAADAALESSDPETNKLQPSRKAEPDTVCDPDVNLWEDLILKPLSPLCHHHTLCRVSSSTRSQCSFCIIWCCECCAAHKPLPLRVSRWDTSQCKCSPTVICGNELQPRSGHVSSQLSTMIHFTFHLHEITQQPPNERQQPCE